MNYDPLKDFLLKPIQAIVDEFYIQEEELEEILKAIKLLLKGIK